MGIPLAITLQVISSFLFASGATLQHLGVKSTFDPNATASSNRLTLMGMLKLLLIPKWLLGLLCVFSGAGLHLWALTMAPVAVVQPVGILAVPWSVLLSSRIHGHQIPFRVWRAVLVTVIGVVGFTVFSSLFAKGEKQFGFMPITWSFIVVCVVCVVLSFFAAKKAAPWAKAIMWSSVGAIFYGLASGMMKAAMNMVQSGPAEITVGTMTTVDPFVAVLFGLFVLGEGADMGAGPAAGMIISGAVAVYGVVMLSKDHPDAVAEREKTAKESAAVKD